MKLKNQITFMEIENETVGVPSELSESPFVGMIRVNDTARDIVELLDNEISIYELTAKMLEKYDADEAVLRQDIRKVIDTLAAKGLIEE